MIKSFWLHAAVLGLSAGLGPSGTALAQSAPAERPPSSYSGDQYVDSRGCVFVRVGFGTTTEWVPRVGRDRNQVCGQTPTGGVGVAAPDLTTIAGVTVIGGPAPAESPAAAPAAPAATRVQPRVSPPIIVSAPPAPAAPSPQVRVATRPAPITVQAPQGGTTRCPDLPASAQPYFTGEDVRCGPQAVFPGRVGPQSNLGGGGSATTGLPRSFALSAPPAGYALAWDDGRLNPLRGVGTPAGEAQMRQVWSDTVPRRLVSVPITTGSAVITRRQRAAAALSARTQAGVEVRATRSRLPVADLDRPAAPSNEVRVGAGHRHVLAGTFAGQGEAAAAYTRLVSAGLPARVGQVSRQGQTLYVVMAGPYNDPQSLGRALLQTRGVGFSGAMTRN